MSRIKGWEKAVGESKPAYVSSTKVLQRLFLKYWKYQNPNIANLTHWLGYKENLTVWDRVPMSRVGKVSRIQRSWCWHLRHGHCTRYGAHVRNLDFWPLSCTTQILKKVLCVIKMNICWNLFSHHGQLWKPNTSRCSSFSLRTMSSSSAPPLPSSWSSSSKLSSLATSLGP